MASLSQLTLGVFSDDPYAALQSVIAVKDHPHPRARIRDFAVKRLRAAALTPAAIRGSRATPTALLTELPAVFVYTLAESEPETYSEGPLVLSRPLELAVYIAVHNGALPAGVDIDDALDGFARVVEILLGNDATNAGPTPGALGGQAARCLLGSTTIKHEEDGERLVAHAGLVFNVTYQDEIAVPVDTYLHRIDIGWDLTRPPRDGVIDAQDLIRAPRTATVRASLPPVRAQLTD